jgi:hypothetical protein
VVGVRPFLLVVALLTLSACQKSPSASYKEASDLYARNRSEEEAAGMAVPDFRDPRWEKVETLLAAVPADSSDYLAARLLLAQVKPGQDAAREAKGRACYLGCENDARICAGRCGCILQKNMMTGFTASCLTNDPRLVGQPIRSPCLDGCEAQLNACVQACPPISVFTAR